jgi:hypothetical protein
MASKSSSSSVKLPRRSLLRIVDGRRVLNSDGKCCPRVEMVVAASLVRGRNSFEFVRRGRLAERGLGGGCGRPLDAGCSDMAARYSRRWLYAP